MSDLTTTLIDEFNREEDKIVAFTPKLITGGKEPPSFPPTSGDWLTPLEKGTMFYTKDRHDPRNFQLAQWIIVEKHEKVIVLANPLSPQSIPVDPLTFCNKFSFYESLGIVLVPEGISLEENPKEDIPKEE